MKKIRVLLMTVLAMLMITAVCYAESMYPATLDNGNLVLVDGHMGVGQYADRSSVAVQRYNPPDYQLSINIVNVTFSEEHYRVHHSYHNCPYTYGNVLTLSFRYNWDRKSVSRQHYDGTWADWNINRDNSHADGNPLVPNTAEVAFVSAYKMRFYNTTMGYSPTLKRYFRVISEDFYRTLGI